MHKLQDTEIFLASRARIVNLDRILLHCFQGLLRLDEVRSSLQYLAHDAEIQAVVFIQPQDRGGAPGILDSVCSVCGAPRL